MMRHRTVRRLLYDYLRGELDPPVHERIERHLRACGKCTRELAALRSAVRFLDGSAGDPGGERPPEFWNAFASGVEERIRQGRPVRRAALSPPAIMARVFTMHRRPLFGFGAAAALLVAAAALLFLRQAPKPPELQAVGTSAELQAPLAEPAGDRLHRYFRKSKVLLVGLANTEGSGDEPVDLSAERRLSRRLVEEARYLRRQPLDRRSERLIGDLERIQIELANLRDDGEKPDIELIRSGIHQENLLFKIRMAESMYDSARVLQAFNRN